MNTTFRPKPIINPRSTEARAQAQRQAKATTSDEALRIAKERRFALSASMLADKNIKVIVKNDPNAPLAYMDIRNNELMLNEGDRRLDMSDPVKALVYTRANLFHEIDHSLFTSNTGNKVEKLSRASSDAHTFNVLRNILEDGRIETLGKKRFAGQADFLNAQLLAIANNLGKTPLDGLHIYVRTGLFRNKAEAKFWQPYKAEIDKAIHAPSTSKMLDIAFAISEAISQPQPPTNGGNGGEGEPEQGGEGTTQGEPQGASEGEEQGEEQGEGAQTSDVDASEDEDKGGDADSGEDDKDDSGEPSDEDGDAKDEGDGDGDKGDEAEGDEGAGDSDSDESGEGDSGDEQSEGGDASDEGEGEGEPSDEASDEQGEQGEQGEQSSISAGKGDSAPPEMDKETLDKLSKIVAKALERCEAEAEADYKAIVAEAEAYEPEQAYLNEGESSASDELTSVFTSLLVESARTKYYGARCGLLNQAALANALTSRKCFHKRYETPNTPHVALLLDVSGSMVMRATDLSQAARVLNGALLKAKISAYTLTFGGDEQGAIYTQKGVEYVDCSETCINAFRTIPTDAPLVTHGGTPTHVAMSAANDWLEGEGATRGLVIVVTDGSPNDLKLAQKELQRAEQSGAYVIGVLVGIDAASFGNPLSTSPVERDYAQSILNALTSQFHEHVFCPNVQNLPSVIAPALAQYIAQR